ncbi:MAG: transposase [Chloroflexota bacterium]|nr:transposase [Chloroflexota bacterium]
MGKYRKHSPEKKVRIVLEILRGEKSLAQASRAYQIKDSLLYRWKDQFLEGAKQSFAYGQPAEQKRRADEVAELERLVGKLTMQLEIAKKASHYVTCLPPESES